jgi:hypothetical protein
MKFLTPLVVVLLVVISLADPLPSGGAPCTSDYNCGGMNAGQCMAVTPGANLTCVCPSNLAKPDCSYVRTSRGLAGGLELGLSFAGINGVGMFVLGNTPVAVAQLIMGFALWFGVCGGCIFFCKGKEMGKMIAVIAIFVFLGLVAFAGWIWTVADGALILEGVITDVNGYATY